MFAYIPARGGSKRIPRKNVRPLAGVPVLARVIQTLRQLEFLSGVYVSSDDPEIIAVAEATGARCLGPRAPELSGDGPGFLDLVRDDLPRFIAAENGDDEVLFVLATAALVPPTVFREAHALWQQRQPDIVMSCEKAHPWWAMTQKPDGYWAPITPEKVFFNSQDLPPSLVDAGLFYFFRQPILSRFTSLKIVDRLLPFVVPAKYAVDVDTEEDWDLLEYWYSRLGGAAK